MRNLKPTYWDFRTGSMIRQLWKGTEPEKQPWIAMPKEQEFYGTLGFRSFDTGGFQILRNLNRIEQFLYLSPEQTMHMLRHEGCVIKDGRVTGTFCICKKGLRYTLKFLSPLRNPGSILFEEIGDGRTGTILSA